MINLLTATWDTQTKEGDEMATVMSGKEVANHIREELNNDLLELNKKNIFPRAAIVRVGDDSASIGYENAAIKLFNKLGIESQSFHFPGDISEEEFIEEFQKINNNDDIHGILLLRPLPSQIDEEKISYIINPDKDIDGMSPVNIGKVLSPQKGDFVPITPESVMRTLEYYGVELEGKNVVIIGHSRVVGRPLSMLLADKNATVTICHVYTKNTAEICKQADIVISATGVAGLVTKDYVKEGAVVVDVGISYVDGKLRGDVDYDNVKELASHITPVPGGIGAITTTLLAQRVVTAAKHLTEKRETVTV